MIWVDGVGASVVPADDRGLQYGDGLFETMRVLRRSVPLLDRHLARLAAGCVRLALPLPDPETLRAEITAACATHDDGVLKLVVTRGSGGRGYRAADAPRLRRVLSLHPRQEWPAQTATGAIRARCCSTRLAIGGPLVGLKHLNRLEQVVARNEWQDAAIAEGLMRDAEGTFVAGTMTNLFVVRDGALLTPTLDRCGVAGIARALVLECAATLKVEVTEQRISSAMLAAADEILVCNSVVGVRPLCELDGRALPAAPVAARLRVATGERGLGA